MKRNTVAVFALASVLWAPLCLAQDPLAPGDQEDLGMAGLSVGGMQTRAITLANLDKFSHTGVFSGGLITPADVDNIASKITSEFCS